MAMEEHQKQQFVDAYTKALVSNWSSEEYAQRLSTDPRSALAEVGIVLPDDARIEIVTNLGADTPAAPSEADSGQGSLDTQIELYERGLETGHFEFHMPATPQVDTSELDIDELAGIAGGGVYCCCCPCCCCG